MLKRALLKTLLLIAVVATTSCFNLADEISFDEVSRVTNPSGKIDAVVVETNGGATTSFGYEVFVIPKGERVIKGKAAVASFYGAVRSETAYGVNVKWERPDQLAIEYLQAKRTDFTKQNVIVNGETITISSRSNVNDESAPSGGMLYNLEKKK
jgi:hypothetical protein